MYEAVLGKFFGSQACRGGKEDSALGPHTSCGEMVTLDLNMLIASSEEENEPDSPWKF